MYNEREGGSRFVQQPRNRYQTSVSISKRAMNLVMAKFNAQYKKDGVLFLGICPGVVDVGNINPADRTDHPPFPHPPTSLASFVFFQKKNTVPINLTISLPTVTPSPARGSAELAQYVPHYKGPGTGRLHPSGEEDLGEWKHGERRWGCVPISSWQQTMDLIGGQRSRGLKLSSGLIV